MRAGVRKGNRIAGGIAAAFSPRGLAGFALWGFFLLSLVATGLGFADLQAANRDTPELPPLELAFTIATTLFVVSAMVVALHTAITRPGLVVRLIAILFYLLFAVWSVGFGYGFFWKEFAGKEFTQAQFGKTIDQMAIALDQSTGSLMRAQSATASAAELARARAETEARNGHTCANRPASTPGEGPLMRARFTFADGAARLSADVQAQWTGPLMARRLQLARRIEALKTRRAPDGADQLPADERALLSRLASARDLPSEQRRVLFTGVHAEAEAFAQTANSLRQRHAGAFADRLMQLAMEAGPDPRNPGQPDPARANDPGYCWDVVLNQQMLTGAEALRAIKDVETPPFEFLEGAKATRAAFFGLASWIGGAVGLPAPGGAIPFGQKEFLALFASLAVDLGILFLTLLRDLPGPRPAGRKAAQGAGDPKPPRLAGLLD